MYGLSVQWEKCPDGVEIVDHGDNDPGQALMDDAGNVRWLRAGKHFRYRTPSRVPLRFDISNLEDPISIRFVNARDDNALILFLSRFGLMPLMQPDEEIPRDHVLSGQAFIRKLLMAVGSGDRKEAVAALNSEAHFGSVFAGRIHRLVPSFNLTPDGNSVQMALNAGTMLGFMSMEAAMAAILGAKLATCDYCGDYFLTGPKTGNRSDAKYHANKCRTAAMRKRNATNGKQGDKS
jgi:hypothetical protein